MSRLRGSRRLTKVALCVAGFLFLAVIGLSVWSIVGSWNEYHGGYAPNGAFCNYGYDVRTEKCCDEDTYSCEVRDKAPKDATAYCHDGTYGKGNDAATAYEGHGGINDDDQFGVRFTGHPLKATALCNDGSYSYSLQRSGSCSGHQGVDEWLIDN